MNEKELVLKWVCGCNYSAKLLNDLFYISQVADDFVDDDVPMDKSDKMVTMLHTCLIDIPSNPIFTKYYSWLAPLMSSSLLLWGASNVWEKSENLDTRAFAYAYREILEQVIIQIALLNGGIEHAKIVTQEIHEHYRQNEECDKFINWSKK